MFDRVRVTSRAALRRNLNSNINHYFPPFSLTQTHTTWHCGLAGFFFWLAKLSIVFLCDVVDWLSGLWLASFLKLYSFYSGNTDKSLQSMNSVWAKWPSFGRVVGGLSQCLLVLEFKTHCQKFPNVSYTLSPFPPEPISLVFYRKYWWENQNKCRFDRKHIAGKAWGYFSNPGLPPSFTVSVCFGVWWLLALFLMQSSIISFNAAISARDVLWRV